MKFFKSKLFISSIITIGVLLFFSIAGYSYFNKQQPQSVDKQITKDTSTNTKTAKKETSESADEDSKEEPKTEIEEEFPLDMSESEVQEDIHYMSHSKVAADEKWGALEITKPKVERLIQVVKHNKNTYENSDLYLDILKQWASGDFSQSVADHNAIWRLQDGSIGKATRLLTPSEQKEYAKNYFGD